MPDEELLKTTAVAREYHTFKVDDGTKKGGDALARVQLSSTSTVIEHTDDAQASGRTAVQKLLPTFILILASFMYSFMHCAVRTATTQYHYGALFIAFFRSILAMGLSGGLIIHFNTYVFPTGLSWHSLGFLLVRGVLGAVAMILHYAALARLPVAIASALFSTKSIFASLLGFIVLGEKLAPSDQGALIITLVGSMLVGASELGTVAAGTVSDYGQGVMCALGSSATIGTIYVLMRWMGTKVHFMLSLFAMSTCAVLTSFLLYVAKDGGVVTSAVYFGTQMQTAHGGALLALLGVTIFSFAGGMCFNRGAQLVPAGRASVLRAADIPVNFLVALVFLGELPRSPMQISGCCLITVGAYLAALKEAS